MDLPSPPGEIILTPKRSPSQSSTSQPQPLTTPAFRSIVPSGCEAVIEFQRPYSTDPQLPLTSQLPLQDCRQIILPFDLRETPAKFHESENSKLIFDLFPGTRQVDFDERVLVFRFDQLPAKPWPKKIAGAPCYLTADPNDQGPIIPIRRRSRSSIAVSENLNLRGNEAAVDLIFDLVRGFFAKTDISITEIQFWGHIIIIVLENESGEAILSAVPRSVAQCNCFYLFESEIARPSTLSAPRLKQISTGQIDDSQYDTIRPGVVLSSGRHQGYDILTSSGVLVRDHLGSEYMTVAAHGFPSFPFEGAVLHPHSSGKTIGEVITKLSHTGVALAKLGLGVEFTNEPFENTVVLAPPSKLTGFIRAVETRIGDDIFLDSPFTGFVEGTRGAHSLLRVSSDDPIEPGQQWIRCQWDYMGQGSSQVMVEGVCGSAIWDRNHKVLGFFRYAPASGVFRDWCMSVSADHLLDKGYTMV